MLIELSLKPIHSTMMSEKFFQIYGVHIPKKCIEFKHFYQCPLPQSKLFPKFLSYQIQLENMKMTWNIKLFIFCMIFFKCDGFKVL